MNNKKIVVTKHAIKRARQRLGIKACTVKRMFLKAIEQNATIYNAGDGSKVICKDNTSFIYKESEKSILIITVTNLNNIQEHKESQTVPIYLKGTKTKHTMRIRGCK